VHYFGSFPIVPRIGPMAYNLKLPPTRKIHLVFHVLVLKKCKGHPHPVLLNKKGCPLQPQIIIDNQIIKKNDKWQEKGLIKWHRLTTKEAIKHRSIAYQMTYGKRKY